MLTTKSRSSSAVASSASLTGVKSGLGALAGGVRLLASPVVVVSTGSVVCGSTGLAKFPRWWNKGFVAASELL